MLLLVLLCTGGVLLICMVVMYLTARRSVQKKKRGTGEKTTVMMDHDLEMGVVEGFPLGDIPRSPSLHSCKSWNAGLTISGIEKGETLAFPSCSAQTMHDWGPGVKSCASCGARPIFNRGCLVCEKRMCMTCFDSHKSLLVTTVELAKMALKKYDVSKTDGLSFTEWNALLHDLDMPEQTREEFNVSCDARGSDPENVGITLDHLVVLSAFLEPGSLERLTRNMPLPSFTPASGPKCAVRVTHDWGPGLASCAICNTLPILNRGCGVCMVKMCGDCFESHVEKAEGELKCEPAKPAETVKPAPFTALSITPDIGRNCKISNSKYRICSNWSVLDDRSNDEFLGEGGSFYFFTFLKGANHPEGVLRMASKLMNLSSFSDETGENFVPNVDLNNATHKEQYFILLNKAIYMIPDIKITDITKDLITSTDYQARCQPGGVKIHDTNEADTFRFTKTIIWPVYKLTMQFKVSVVDPSTYGDLSELQDGLPVHFALLLERTKRNKQAVDVIKKAKSILLYHQIPEGSGGGVVVTNVTTGAATSVPSVIATIVDKLGSMGAKDVAETAIKTRKYFNEERKK
eukprot:TRINITY_DN7531_c0_g1_i1.p1 TRINITY_DN7531_c0_g1~~TRINITY_DN7531_c0_g1_i1.p1  ORF type:complete len:595 (+),score=83.81 TRINITY_DN7531_c0_g1_i1:62-1786(+)